MSLLDRFIKRTVKETFDAAMKKAMADVLPGMVERAMADKFKSEPNRQLSALGFNWALALSLKEHWPDVSNIDAVYMLREYIDIPHGHPDHDWSYNAAQEIAREYVNEVGEVV